MARRRQLLTTALTFLQHGLFIQKLGKLIDNPICNYIQKYKQITGPKSFILHNTIKSGAKWYYPKKIVYLHCHESVQ